MGDMIKSDVEMPSEEELEITLVREKTQNTDQLKSFSADVVSAEKLQLDAAAEAQQKLEKLRKDRNFAFREWLFEYFPKYVEKNSLLIQEMEYLKDKLVLTPAEQIIFQKTLEAWNVLHAVQKDFIEKLKMISLEEFSQKSEEEQVQIIFGMYDEKYLVALVNVAFPAFNLSRYLDKIFRIHLAEIQALPEKEQFSFLRRETNFETEARLMQVVTRIPLLAKGVSSYLESTQSQFQELLNKFEEVGNHINELKRVNALRHSLHGTPSNANIDRKAFLQDGIAENFLSFLGNDTQKIAYFKLLQRLNAQGRVLLTENRRKSILHVEGKPSDVEIIKELFPFFAESLDELLEMSKGKEGDPKAKETVELAFNTILSLLFELLEPDFVIFSRKVMEYTVPRESLDIDELGDEVAIIPPESIKVPLSKPKLERSQSESDLQLQKAQPESRAKRTSSLKRLSMMLGERVGKTTTQFQSVASAAKKRTSQLWTKRERKYIPKESEPTALQVPVSFFQFAGFVLKKVEAYKSIVDDMKSDDGKQITDRRITGWEFVYTRDEQELKNDIPHDGFKPGDDVKVLHHEDHVFTVSPENIEGNDAEGISVVVHRHEQEDMHLAVQVMVEAMAKTGKKEICISLGEGAPPESEELILAYARVILSQNAIPIVMIDGKELNREQSKRKLQEIADRALRNGKQSSSKTAISEWYSATVACIEQMQKEDNADLEKFNLFIEELKTEPEYHNTIMDWFTRLIKISLVHRNLTEEDLVKKIVLCVQSSLLAAKKIPADKMSQIESKLLFELQRFLAKGSNAKDLETDGSELPVNILAAKLFAVALINLEDYAFLQAFSTLLEQLETSSFAEKEITLQDPNTGRTLSSNDILTHLAQIALINKNIEEDEFINKFIWFALHLLPEYDAEEPLSDAIIEDLKLVAQRRIQQYRTNSEISVGKLVADLLEEMPRTLTAHPVASPSVENDLLEPVVEKQNDKEGILREDIVISEFNMPEPVKVEFIGFEKESTETEMALGNHSDAKPVIAEKNELAVGKSTDLNPATSAKERKPASVLAVMPKQPIAPKTPQNPLPAVASTTSPDSRTAKRNVLAQLAATVQSGIQLRKTPEQKPKDPINPTAMYSLQQTIAATMAKRGSTTAEAEEVEENLNNDDWSDNEDSDSSNAIVGGFGFFGNRCPTATNAEVKKADPSAPASTSVGTEKKGITPSFSPYGKRFH